MLLTCFLKSLEIGGLNLAKVILLKKYWELRYFLSSARLALVKFLSKSKTILSSSGSVVPIKAKLERKRNKR